MKTALSEFIAEINRSRKSGLLSINVKDANTLLKLFFREGEVYHMTCGNVRGTACLAQLTGGEFMEYFFMPNVALNVHDEDLPSLMDILSRCNAGGMAVEISPHTGRGAGPAAGAPAVSGQPAMLEGLKTALIRQIGPAGAKVMSRIVAQTWQASSPATREELLSLVDLLKAEIENDDDQNEFLKEAKTILS